MPRPALPPIHLDETVPILRPEKPEEGYWVGAPSVHSNGSKTYLATRKRTPHARGHTLVVHERTGPTTYDPVVEVRAADLGVESIERPALLTDPETDGWKLYLAVDHDANEWTVQKLDDAPSPRAFDPSTAREVLGPRPGSSDGGMVKDPYVLHHGGRYYMYYAGSDGQSEQAHLATSRDGESWTRAAANPVLRRCNWHDHHTRITCVVPQSNASGWLVFYDGSGAADYQNSWNLRTGVGVTPDLTTVTDASANGPVYTTATGGPGSAKDRYETFRYVDVLVEEEWTVFFEAAREDEAFELRQATVRVDG